MPTSDIRKMIFDGSINTDADEKEIINEFSFTAKPTRISFKIQDDQIERIETEDKGTERELILEKAMNCVCGEREEDYGTPENNFKMIASLWNSYLDVDYEVSPLDVSIMMALLKIARIRTGTATEDSFIDLAGYAACGGEIASNMKQKSVFGES